MMDAVMENLVKPILRGAIPSAAGSAGDRRVLPLDSTLAAAGWHKCLFAQHRAPKRHQEAELSYAEQSS